MNALLICSLGLAPLQQPIAPAVRAAPPELVKYRVAASLESGSTTADANFILEQTRTAADNQGFKLDFKFTEFDAKVNGSTFPFPKESTAAVQTDSKGAITAIKSNLPILDAPRLLVMAVFAWPADSLELGKETRWTTPASSDKRMPGWERTATWKSSETVGELECMVVEVKLKEVLGNMTASLTYWVTPDGTVSKVNGTYQGMSIAMLGTDAQGKFSAEIVASP